MRSAPAATIPIFPGTTSASGTDRSVRPSAGNDTSVGKTLALLDAFCGPLTVLGVTELANRAHIPKSTAHRLLTVLVSRGYVRRFGDRYSLTEHLFEIGNHVKTCRPSGIRELAMPYIGELFAQTRQTVQLAVLAGTDILYLDRVVGRDALRCETPVGGRRPTYATALGKALLAHSAQSAVEANLRVRFHRFTPYTIVSAPQLKRSLDRVVRDGVATDHEESAPGVHCLAAPVIDQRTGLAVAAVSVRSRHASANQQHSRALLRATEELSRLRLSHL